MLYEFRELLGCRGHSIANSIYISEDQVDKIKEICNLNISVKTMSNLISLK
jgi:hypothetical protein